MTELKVGEIFERDIHRRIEEVVKVDQTNETVVAEEIAEYVVTDAIARSYRGVLQAIANSVSEPTEGVGIWVSGFFGSGKSSFAKILGYILEDCQVLGELATDRFLRRIKDEGLANLLRWMNTRLPMTSVVFDISEDRFVRTTAERVSEVMYRAFLRTLGYATDFDLAELEIGLEKVGRLPAFEEAYQRRYGRPWVEGRMEGGFAISEASAVLHDLDPATYPAADSWARSRGHTDISPNQFADRAFDLMRRRRPGRSLVFVIDEVGQYVSRSVDKMLDLAGVVQAFGKTGRNLVQSKQADGQAWIVVTAQEKLDEVMDALGGKKIELARLEARFPIRVDLVPADISEVASKRVLTKKPEIERHLEQLFEERGARLNLLARLERTSRPSQISREAFVNLYPFPPHFIDLAIDIVSGIRLQPGAQRHIGGSNRTIISQTQQAITAEGVGLAEAPVGRLVTLDLLYDLLRSNIASERQKDIFDIERRFPDMPLAAKVAKAICLLQYVKDLPRTIENIAALLYPDLTSDSVREQVQAAIEALERAQFIRLAEDGYKLQSLQEKSWETERRAIESKPAERSRLLREVLGEVFADPAVRVYKHAGLRTFRVGITVGGERAGEEGDIEFNVVVAEDPQELGDRCAETRELSREKSREHALFLVLPLTEAVHRGIEEVFRSREMIDRYERQTGKLTGEEITLLGDEKSRRDRAVRTLRASMTETVLGGSVFFRGVERALATMGQTLSEAVHGILAWSVPDLYPKFALGARPVAGEEATRILTAANLNGLPPVFYEGPEGLGLVVRQGDRFVPNPNAEIAKEILDHIRRQHSYGSRVTGKALEQHFRGIGFGWELDIVRVVLATLLRSNQIEVTTQGRRTRKYDDPLAREALSKLPTFRAATFAPRETLDLKMLTGAARNYEQLVGAEVDIEEGAIARAIQDLAREERDKVVPLRAKMSALKLPGLEFLFDYQQTLDGLIESPADECVATLARIGPSLREGRDRVRRFVEATNDAGLERLRMARAVLLFKAPQLGRRLLPADPVRDAVRRLEQNLHAESFPERLPFIAEDAATISRAFDDMYKALHRSRGEVYAKAVEEVRGTPEWPQVPREVQDRVLRPLLARACEELVDEVTEHGCGTCQATLDQLDSDLAAVEGLKREILAEVERLTGTEDRIQRVRVSEFFRGTVSDTEEFRAALRRLEEQVVKLLSEGYRVIIE